MTNPDNMVRVRARAGGRASVYEANGWAQAYTGGLLSGNGATQNTSADMNVLVGGTQSSPDVVLAENPVGYKVALDLVSREAITLTAPASNSRISAIIAYTDDLSLASSETTITGSPATCGLIVVNGASSSSPVAPTDTEIRTAITEDGATGSQAAYAIVATVKIDSDTTIITDGLITNNRSSLGNSIMSVLYPVGSYYETSDETFDPNESWGGTWVKDTAGKVLVAQDESDQNETNSFAVVGDTGGEKTHQLTISEMPSHSHSYTTATNSASGTGGNRVMRSASYYDASWNVNSNGGDQAHNNVQPYIVVVRWHRIA